jgi:sigma-B regulation protein RsbQ
VECASQADQEVAKRVVQQTFLSDYRMQVPLLTCPTLLLQCTNDPAVPEEVSHYLLAHLPQATLVTLPTEGHCPHLTAPTEVLQAIQQFLALA